MSKKLYGFAGAACAALAMVFAVADSSWFFYRPVHKRNAQ